MCKRGPSRKKRAHLAALNTKYLGISRMYTKLTWRKKYILSYIVHDTSRESYLTLMRDTVTIGYIRTLYITQLFTQRYESG